MKVLVFDSETSGLPDEPIPEDLHNSLIDVAITLRCYIKYVYNSDVKEVNETLAKLL